MEIPDAMARDIAEIGVWELGIEEVECGVSCVNDKRLVLELRGRGHLLIVGVRIFIKSRITDMHKHFHKQFVQHGHSEFRGCWGLYVFAFGLNN